MKKMVISIMVIVAIATFVACNMKAEKDEMAVARLNLVNVEGNLEDKIEVNNEKKDDHVWSSSGNGVHVFHGAEGFYEALEHIELTEYRVDDTHYVR
jgi:hypothetical protein